MAFLGARVSHGVVGKQDWCYQCANDFDRNKFHGASKTYHMEVEQCVRCGKKTDDPLPSRVKKFIAERCWYCWNEILPSGPLSLDRVPEVVYLQPIPGKYYYAHKDCYDRA